MGRDRQKEIKRHLTEEELDKKLAETDDPKIVRRLCFVKNLYHGDTLVEAAVRVGKSQPTSVRWAKRWNEGGLDELAPSFGDGRPPKLDKSDRERLIELLKADQPWTTQEIRQLIQDEFNVSYHPNYIHELLRSFDMKYAKPRPRRPERPDDAVEILDERIGQTLEESDAENDDDEPVTDGGYVVGFLTRRGRNRPTTATESGRSTFQK